MVWPMCKFRHNLVIYNDRYSLQKLCIMKALDCTLLHRWRSELEEFNFVVDTPSHLPRGTTDDEEALGIRAIAELLTDLQVELLHINEATQQGMLMQKNVVSMYGCSLNAEVHILVGSRATQHLMEILHNTAAGHMGSRKLLAKFKECYTYG